MSSFVLICQSSWNIVFIILFPFFFLFSPREEESSQNLLVILRSFQNRLFRSKYRFKCAKSARCCTRVFFLTHFELPKNFVKYEDLLFQIFYFIFCLPFIFFFECQFSCENFSFFLPYFQVLEVLSAEFLNPAMSPHKGILLYIYIYIFALLICTVLTGKDVCFRLCFFYFYLPFFHLCIFKSSSKVIMPMFNVFQSWVCYECCWHLGNLVDVLHYMWIDWALP